ncbi:MAG TPA: FHA domain-containing protein [Roseiflexaceae bacterium]|nr:FHA domain-containing protein [Roseiflexaceae bacterium]
MICCASCGNENVDNAAFCDNCGMPLAAPGTAQAFTPVAGVQASAASGSVCPACGGTVVPGEAFCEQCGATLNAPVPAAVGISPQMPTSAGKPTVSQSAAGSLHGLRLVIQSDGTEVALPNKSNVIIGRADPASQFFPDVDLDRFDALNHGVSRRHASVQIQSGQIVIQDLDTANGTAINRQPLAPHQPEPIHDGDELRFGKLVATIRLG